MGLLLLCLLKTSAAVPTPSNGFEMLLLSIGCSGMPVQADFKNPRYASHHRKHTLFHKVPAVDLTDANPGQSHIGQQLPSEVNIFLP